MRRYIIAFCLILFLNACASNAINTEYYYLPNSDFIPPLQINNAVEVTVNTADYLSSSSIAIGEKNTNSIHLTTNHLWAESLSKAIQSNISNKLNQLGMSNSYAFSIYPNPNASERLEIVIDRFQVNLDGTVEVAGHAKLLDAQDKIKNALAFKETALQKTHGYQGMLEALDDALMQVANKIYIFF
ncbi:MAG: ABC-type transport auxiliary lipoprotein family protein [Neisseriaceae bacterium]|nr:ABC-type transport auxiliary lipoprotein family protein [Neisseriaceae bacterium]